MNPFATSILDIVAAVLVCGLGDDSFATREACSVAAAQCEWVQPYLMAARQSPDIEVARRAERLTEDAERRLTVALIRSLTPPGFDRWPWLDYSLDQVASGPVVGLYLGRVNERCGWIIAEHWPNYRLATELYVRDQLRAGTPFATLREQMHRGAAKEREWRVGQGLAAD